MSEVPPFKADPLIKALIDRLPRTGEIWPEADRFQWLCAMEQAFRMIYADAPPVKPPPRPEPSKPFRKG